MLRTTGHIVKGTISQSLSSFSSLTEETNHLYPYSHTTPINPFFKENTQKQQVVPSHLRIGCYFKIPSDTKMMGAANRST